MTAAPVAAPAAGTATPARLPLGSVLAGALSVTLLRPATWALGLAGFLAGGGVVLVAWPILVLPTPTGLQNALGGPVSSLVFGDPSAGLLALIAGGIAVGIALVVGGTVAGAWAEREGIGIVIEAATEDGLVAAPPGPGGPVATPASAAAPGTWQVALIRLLALAPVLLAVTLAWPPIYDAAYRELVLPQDLATPLALRVAGRVPGLLAGVIAVWLLADAAGAVGVRRLVLERPPVLRAWALGWTELVRRPHRVLPTALAGLLVLVLLLAPAMLTASIGWERLRGILDGDTPPPIMLAGVVTWVATWLGGLVLASVGAAIRAAAWTLEAAPSPAPLPSPD